MSNSHMECVVLNFIKAIEWFESLFLLENDVNLTTIECRLLLLVRPFRKL